ncbi:MAG: bifunctional pyr operon transcriptional regulator/uracil phosphoribosyltransferase PyrR [Flavobacteriales bacterium]|nr:bifunctional pyr operon transcriptional regulator/uracil phosphoribosyltransferase PyrR [Flavobacteriales bacterium]
MRTSVILGSKAFALTLTRLCYQLIEDHGDLRRTVLLGLQPRGVLLARRLRDELAGILKHEEFLYGELDITFHRDDFRRRATPLAPSATQLDITIDGLPVVLIDDVLYTGRSIRAGLDALLAFGRPGQVQLLTLIDRRFQRELPIQPDYVGRWVDSLSGQRVSVEWTETEKADRVVLETDIAQERGGSPTTSPSSHEH